jgi:hypothetical protein
MHVSATVKVGGRIDGPVCPRRGGDRPATDTGEELDQGALARTVLADEGMDLARNEIERDVFERLRGREPL